MTIDFKIWDFPPLAIGPQLFHVPGSAFDGGFTSGGARIVSPDPGGRSILEMQPALHNEWDAPFCSWLMSKVNGQIFRTQLAQTPQIVTSAAMVGGGSSIKSDLLGKFTAIALEGSTTVKVNMLPFGAILKVGHVVGHDDYCYLVDEIAYDGAGIATITVNPPVRKDIAVNDAVKFRPNFLGMIMNPEEIKASYDPENAGYIQLGRILFSEVVL
jgi:hypothetical protein